MRLFSRSKKPKSSSDSREPEHEHDSNEYLEKPKNEDDTKPPIPAEAVQKWKCDPDYEAAFRDLEEELLRELLSPHPNAIPRIIQNKRTADKAEWIINATFQRQQRLRELKSRMRMQHEDECLKDREILEKSTPPSSSPDKSIQARLTREIITLLRTRNIWMENLAVLFMENRSCALTKLRALARQHCNQYGRTFIWLRNRARCADFGGCCGRACNCCEKPLHTYLRPTDEGERELIEVRGHCTGECACCIRFYRFYGQADGLPTTAFRNSRFWC